MSLDMSHVPSTWHVNWICHTCQALDMSLHVTRASQLTSHKCLALDMSLTSSRLSMSGAESAWVGRVAVGRRRSVLGGAVRGQVLPSIEVLNRSSLLTLWSEEHHINNNTSQLCPNHPHHLATLNYSQVFFLEWFILHIQQSTVTVGCTL